MTKYVVFLRNPLGKNDYEYCQTRVDAESEELALTKYQDQGNYQPLFAMPYDEVLAAHPEGLGKYPVFAPYFALQAAARGVEISAYYREHHLKGVNVAAEKPIGPRKPPPEVPPPVWDVRPINADAAMAAVRSSCESYRSSRP